MDERKMVRSKEAGVFFGKIESRNGNTVVMSNARRIWRWEGASSLSELAEHGTALPRNCKFPCAVTEVEIFEIIEILGVTEKAAASIDGVPEWKQR